MPGLLVFDDAGTLKAIYDQADGESALSYHCTSVSSGYFWIEDGSFVDLEEIRDRVSQAGVPLYGINVLLSAADGGEVLAEAYIAGNSYADCQDVPPFDLDIP